jgi:Fe-Mn family superoxide dismutase
MNNPAPTVPDAAAQHAARAFLAGIDGGPAAGQPLLDTLNRASESLGAGPDHAAGALLLDVRRSAAFAAASELIAGAQWRNPVTVADWAGGLPPQCAVLVYCVHGHEVSRSVALLLCAAGVPAQFLRGGIASWSAAGRPLGAKPAQPGEAA